MNFNQIKGLLVDQRAKVKQGLAKGGDLAAKRFGHGSQINQAEQQIDNYLDREAAQRTKNNPEAGGPAA